MIHPQIAQQLARQAAAAHLADAEGRRRARQATAHERAARRPRRLRLLGRRDLFPTLSR